MNKAEILANALKKVSVTIDGLGDIELQELSAQAMADYLKEFKADDDDSVSSLAKMCQLSIINDGKLVFNDDDLEEIKGMSFGVLNEIQKEILPLNGMGDSLEIAQEK